MKIVLDTNVIVSALINPNGAPARVLALVLSGKVILLYDNRVLAEYETVLRRIEFDFPQAAIADLLAYLNSAGEFVNAEPQKAKLPDETDRKFYEIYKSGAADYLVTGNLKHFPQEKRIVAPRDYLRESYEL
ncbi:MAG: putative toxin-antitoxin system toxin component, PIN family [Candidatus Margulisbacteria bacterium]|jgi:putative PIN family toxin of toxin-antitoxin system|nr:putative toxin-antitoxin system toxin component, PIN family [Candidatus Margulisiibacteriota bacterium]